MQVTINGKQERLGPCTIEQMVRAKGLKAETLVVEHNRQVVYRERWRHISLEEGDVVELLRFVGGG